MKKNSGFTFIEVILALMIFTINMIFGMSFFVYGNQSRVRSEDTGFILEQVRNKIEEYKSRPYNEIVTSNQAETFFHNNLYGYNVSGRVSVSDVGTLDDSDGKYKIITVSATYVRHGISKDLILSAIKAAPSQP
jgi:prepilin-type N-terminal cleavage/methylation domain-containing protein